MKFRIIFFFITLLAYTTYAQQKTEETDSLRREAKFHAALKNNEISLNPETPALNQIAGAPKAFYTYYWEFGDGHYSTEQNPKHVYKKPGDYEVRFWATNHYDTGKPPATRPQKVSVKTTSIPYNDEASMDTDLSLRKNRDPVPGEDMAIVLGYKNTKNHITSGKLYLFYNEQKYKDDNFEPAEVRLHYNEQLFTEEPIVFASERSPEHSLLASNVNNIRDIEEVQDSTEHTNLPLSLEDANAYYRNREAIAFNDLKPGEERNVFFTLRTTPEMLKDTSAIITVRSIYVPDNNYDNHKIKDMEMEIVTSHDPNKMSTSNTFMNYRLVRFKRVKYKIRFQNNGEGPARTIRLETDIPGIYDKRTIEVESMYPECPICPKEPVEYSCLDTTYTDKQAIFTFKNIYLPGSEQRNVKEYDSTKGYVKYSLKFGDDFHKIKTRSKTAIIFDKNEPIITNYSTTRFLPGISIGLKAGYNYYPKLENSKSPFVAATISPFKSYRWYWQAEFSNSFHSYEANSFEETFNDKQGFRQLQRTYTKTAYNNVNWEVPLLIKYNINNYLAVGSGIQANFDLSSKQEKEITLEEYEGPTDQFLINSTTTNEEQKDSFTNIKTGLLIDFTAGFARIGPSLGARYVINTEKGFNYWQFYARWKF